MMQTWGEWLTSTLPLFGKAGAVPFNEAPAEKVGSQSWWSTLPASALYTGKLTTIATPSFGLHLMRGFVQTYVAKYMLCRRCRDWRKKHETAMFKAGETGGYQ